MITTGQFPPRSRLLRSADFKRVFERSCRIGSDYLTVLARPNGLGHPRLGLAVSKKHVKSAVRRNGIKRQARESFRLHQSDLAPLDVVILTRPGAAKATPQTLRLFLDAAWRQLNQRCNAS